MDKFDLLLQKNPINVPVRKKLTQDTMDILIQIKRTRLARRMLAVLFAITVLLLIIKWLNNDVLYFLQLVFRKFAIVKAQSSLFWAALLESLPKEQLISMLIASIVWAGWKRFETFLLHSRITTTKQTFAMRMIKLTPRLLVANALIVITAIGFSGYSYAQKTEQQKLQLLKEHINQSGRTEFETNISAESCDTTNNPNITNQYEIKKGTSINSSDAVKIIEAACNQTEAQKFLIQTFKLGDPNKGIAGVENSDNSETTTDIVSQIVKKTNDTISLQQPGPYIASLQTLSLIPDTKVYKNNALVPQDTVKENDIVMVLTKNYYTSTEFGHPSGDVTKRALLGVYILPADPEFTWYNLTLQHSVTQIEMCPGNPQDRCTFTGSIDFFPSGGGEGNTKNPDYIQSENGVIKEIAGVLTEIGEKSIKIKTSSGRVFTINFDSDPVSEFNRDRAQYYNNKLVGLGDTILVTYTELSNQHATTIATDKIFNAVVMLEVVNKTDPVKKY